MAVGNFLGALTMFGAFISDALNGLILLPQIVQKGSCPNVNVVQNFNIEQYMGRWYELERFANFFQSGACGTADYKLFPNGSVSVINTQVVDGKLDSAIGLATPGPNPSEGALLVSFPGPAAAKVNEPNYLILNLDDSSYSVVYTCSEFAGQKIEFSWILGREPYLPKTKLDVLKRSVQKYGIDVSRYTPTRQLLCDRRKPV